MSFPQYADHDGLGLAEVVTPGMPYSGVLDLPTSTTPAAR